MVYFQVRYDSRVEIYERKMFIRLATDFRHVLRNEGWRERKSLNFRWTCKNLFFLKIWKKLAVDL